MGSAADAMMDVAAAQPRAPQRDPVARSEPSNAGEFDAMVEDHPADAAEERQDPNKPRRTPKSREAAADPAAPTPAQTQVTTDAVPIAAPQAEPPAAPFVLQIAATTQSAQTQTPAQNTAPAPQAQTPQDAPAPAAPQTAAPSAPAAPMAAAAKPQQNTQPTAPAASTTPAQQAAAPAPQHVQQQAATTPQPELAPAQQTQKPQRTASTAQQPAQASTADAPAPQTAQQQQVQSAAPITDAPIAAAESAPKQDVVAALTAPNAREAPRAEDKLRAVLNTGKNAEAPAADAATVKTAPPRARATIGQAAQNAIKESLGAIAAQIDTQSSAPSQQTQAVSAPQASQAAAHAERIAAEANIARAPHAAAQVGREIIRRFNGESTRFELRLDPPELGRIEVKLEVSRVRRVTAVVAADNPQALGELSRHARELEQALQSAGLELAENGLSFDLSDRGNQFTANEDAAPGATPRGGGVDGANSEPETQRSARPIGLERWRGVRVDLVA